MNSAFLSGSIKVPLPARRRPRTLVVAMRWIARPIVVAALGTWACALHPPPSGHPDRFVPTTIDHYFNRQETLTRCDVDVRALGPVGDGVTDDTAAQRAIDLTPAGGTLYIADGTYLVNAGRSLVLKSGPSAQACIRGDLAVHAQRSHRLRGP